MAMPVVLILGWGHVQQSAVKLPALKAAIVFMVASRQQKMWQILRQRFNCTMAPWMKGSMPVFLHTKKLKKNNVRYELYIYEGANMLFIMIPHLQDIMRQQQNSHGREALNSLKNMC
jgi:hypothetical protein